MYYKYIYYHGFFCSLPYKGYIGGVFGIPGEAFEKVNGFSNLYFGWGREDDDFRERLLFIFIYPYSFFKFISVFDHLKA